jgi:hypothetical protein
VARLARKRKRCVIQSPTFCGKKALCVIRTRSVGPACGDDPIKGALRGFDLAGSQLCTLRDPARDCARQGQDSRRARRADSTSPDNAVKTGT